MPRKHDRTGRGTHDFRHVRLYDYLLTSSAWLSLSCQSRSLLIEIARLYDGTNNGRIALSVRVAAQRCRIAKDTASRAFQELEDRAFIECVKRGAYSLKTRHASEWRITWRRCDVTGQLPTNPFKWWGREKQNTVPNYSATVPPNGPYSNQNRLSGS
jgi:hypothetical protein